jgi:hypothetical protein
MLRKAKTTGKKGKLTLGPSVLVTQVTLFILVAIAEGCGKDPDL